MRCAFLLIVLLSIVHASPQSQDASEAGARVTVDSIELIAVGPEQIQLAVNSHVLALKKVTAKRIEFEQMDVNGIPLQLEPIFQRIALTPNQPVALPPIGVTVRTRDLTSVEPLLAAASTGRATINGRARLDLDLNFLGRLFSGHLNGQAAIPIHGEILFELPGGDEARSALLTALHGLQLLMGTLGGLLQ